MSYWPSPFRHDMAFTNRLARYAFDRDNDEILDWWEIAHGLSPTNDTDAVQDFDGDGFINLYEYLAGTNPNDATENGAGTALYAAMHGVDDRITNTDYTVATKYYAGYSPKGYGITGELQNVHFDLNTNCWMYNVDMSCLSVYDDGPQGDWRHPLTAITPQHVISATHVSPSNGLRVTFQSLAGDVVVRTLVAQTFIQGVADDDLWLGLLDSPLPSCIKPAQMLPSNYASHIGTGRKLPIVRIGREKECSIQDIVYLAPSENHLRMCRLEYSKDPVRFQYRRDALAMDSGHPLFILFGDELAFVCPARGFYYSEGRATGYLCTYYKEPIQRAIDELSALSGVELRNIDEFDLSAYLQNGANGQ